MFYVRIGLRNIIKSFRRSLLTMIPIIIGMVSCLLTQGFFNWNINELSESMIHKGIGHFQLYAAGFSKYGSDDPFGYLIEEPAPIIRDLQAIPEIELVTSRMAFSGILSSGNTSAVAVGEAGNPAKEIKLNFYADLKEGCNLNSQRPNGLIIGDGVAKQLAAKIGDTLTLMGTMRGGVINAVDLELSGITHSGYADLDNVSASTTLGVIQNLLNIDQSAQKIIVLLKDTHDMEKVLPKVKRIAIKYHLEYKEWRSLAEFYQSLKLMYNVVFWVIMLIVLMIVTFTISNTVNMNLNDRIREIGTIRALGTQRSQVALIFMTESLLLGLIGGLIGLAVSFLFIGGIELIGGLPVAVQGTEQPTVMHVFFHPDVKTILLCMALFSLVAMVASIVPSQRASKLSISDALRWI